MASVHADAKGQEEKVRYLLANFWLNRRRLSSTLHPPLIPTVRPKQKMNLTSSYCSWNSTKRSIHPLWPYPFNTSDDISLLLVFCGWSQRLMIFNYHSVFVQILFIDWMCHLLIISVVVPFSLIISMTYLDRTQNWLGYSQHGKCWLLPIVWRNCWGNDCVLLTVQVIHSIKYLPSSYMTKCWTLVDTV